MGGERYRQIYVLQELRDYLSNRIYHTRRTLKHLRKKSCTNGISRRGWARVRDLTVEYVKELEAELERVKAEIRKLQREEIERRRKEKELQGDRV